MNPTIVIPRGTNILQFLHELDGKGNRTKSAWIFMRKDVIDELEKQLGAPVILDHFTAKFTQCHTSTKAPLLSILLRNTSNLDAFPAQWSTVMELACHENAPFSIAFQTPSLEPSEALFLVMQD